MKIRLCHVSNSSSMSCIVFGKNITHNLHNLEELVKSERLYAKGDYEPNEGVDFFRIKKAMLTLWQKNYIDLEFYDVDYIDKSDSTIVTIQKDKLSDDKEISLMAVDIATHRTKTMKEFRERYLHED